MLSSTRVSVRADLSAVPCAYTAGAGAATKAKTTAAAPIHLLSMKNLLSMKETTASALQGPNLDRRVRDKVYVSVTSIRGQAV